MHAYKSIFASLTITLKYDLNAFRYTQQLERIRPVHFPQRHVELMKFENM